MQPMHMYMVPNPGIPGCPPGLEYLTQVDQLLIKQKVELIEALAGFESNNKYDIRNSMGQNVFYAVEENDCLTRQCCGPLRSFTIRVLDNIGQEIITVSRPLKCMSCFFPCCLQELEIQAPPGNTVGYVLQQWHPFLPKFTIQNEHREPVLKLQGPFCGWSCLPDVDFEHCATTYRRILLTHPLNNINKCCGIDFRASFICLMAQALSVPLNSNTPTMHLNTSRFQTMFAFVHLLFKQRYAGCENRAETSKKTLASHCAGCIIDLIE
ncbi:phospholipid scramblase 2 isoform X2 [Chanodichthys erythropterus]